MTTKREGKDAGAWGRPGSPRSDGAAAALDRTLALVRAELGRRAGVAWWSATTTVTRSDQLYLIGERVEAERHNEQHGVVVRIRVGSDAEIGEGSVSLGVGEDDRFAERLDRAIEVAGRARIPAYPPHPPAPLPRVECVDEEIATDPARALERLRGELSAGLAGNPASRIASAEFFVYHDLTRMETSTGIVADLSGTRSTAELVLLGQEPGGREAEVQGMRHRRSLQDLDTASWAAALAEESVAASVAEPMPSWRGPVVLRADALHAFFGPLRQRLSGEVVHRGISPYAVGDSVVPSPVEGDPLTVATDRLLPFGLETAPCDPDGVPASRVVLVENGIVRRFCADQRHAHYLGLSSTGRWGNLVVEPGAWPSADLFSGREVLEVVRFSWFTPDGGTGDFASEVRLGYLHRNGRRVPVKGGAVTGNAFAALAHARLTRETRFVGNGLVPRYLCLEDLVVTGA